MPRTLFYPFNSRQDALGAYREDRLKLVLAGSNLLRDPRVGLPSHPFRFRWRRHIRPVVISPELAVQTRKPMMGLVHPVAALRGISKPVAIPAGK
jgi:hypothetical protein